MNCAEIAHLLKSLGKGQEALGVVKLFNAGKIVGAGEVLIIAGGAIGLYKLCTWGYQKISNYIEDQRKTAIVVPGEVH